VFKDLADRKAEIFDEDLHAIAGGDGVEVGDELDRFISLSRGTPRPASVPMLGSFSPRVVMNKRLKAQGNGPVDATVKAIESVVSSGAELLCRFR